jgi:DNA-binding transcriptional LysR family regulator
MIVVPKSHPLAKKRKLRVADLAAQKMIVPPEGRPHRVAIENAFRRARVTLDIAVEASGWETTLHFVSLGLGLAIVNGCCRLPRGLRGKPFDEIAPVEYRVVHAKHPRAQVTALRDTLVAYGDAWRDADDVAWSRR